MISSPRPSYLTRVRRRLDLLVRRGRIFWVKRVARKPFWFTDRHGVTLMAHPEDDLDVLFAYRHFFDDEGTLRLCERMLRPGMTVFDVGANYGQFTLWAAEQVGPSGSVHAFEPSSYSFGRLGTNVGRDPRLAARVALNRCAVADRPGVVRLHSYGAEHSAWNSLHAHAMWDSMEARETRRPPLRPTGGEDVPAVTLDQYCAEKGVARIDLLKIDVEGAELAVLDGAGRLIADGRVSAVVFEISLDALAGTSCTPEGILQTVAALGYRVGQITGDGGTIDATNATFRAPLLANYLARPTTEAL
jgi:FkbM family methyltransferase